VKRVVVVRWPQVYESEQEYHDELGRLSDELARCKLESSQHEAVLNSVRLSSDEKISQLQEDKAVLQVCVRSSACAVVGLCEHCDEVK